MDEKYVMRIARTIVEQICSSTTTPVLMSWDIEELVATIYDNKPALRIKVNGRLHAGYVFIALNGSDYYEVYLVNDTETKCVNKEVCFVELGDVIDQAIESGTDKAEYDRFCDQQLVKLFD